MKVNRNSLHGPTELKTGLMSPITFIQEWNNMMT